MARVPLVNRRAMAATASAGRDVIRPSAASREQIKAALKPVSVCSDTSPVVLNSEKRETRSSQIGPAD